MIRIPFGEMTIDQAKIIQNAFVSTRDKYPERHPKRITGTVQLKKAAGLSKQFVHVWVHISSIKSKKV